MTDAPAAIPPTGPARRPRWLHVPLPMLISAAGVALGYYSCDHLVTGFDLLAFLPLIGGLMLLLFIFSCAVLAWRSPKEKKLYAPILHFPIVVLVAVVSFRYFSLAGTWVWEQTVLKPRRGVLTDLARRSAYDPHTPVDVAGYRFEGVERTSDGAMFYTVLAGGPFVSKGIFVSLAPGYRGFAAPAEGEPRSCRSVQPTSVDGLFWFVTRD